MSSSNSFAEHLQLIQAGISQPSVNAAQASINVAPAMAAEVNAAPAMAAQVEEPLNLMQLNFRSNCNRAEFANKP